MIDAYLDAHYTEHARRLHDSVAAVLPYTFRHGSVLCTIRAVETDGWRFSVLDAEASYDGRPVELDLPLHYLNATTENVLNPLIDVHQHLANTVRHHVDQAAD